VREPLCEHRPCLVMGPSRDQSRVSMHPALVVIGANGGASIARNLGFTVDILCTTSHLFRSNSTEAEQATVNSMRGLRVRQLYMDTQCGYLNRLDDYDILADLINTVPGGVRRTVVREACGGDLWVSTSVWAVCLALVSGAKSVTVRGVSLTDRLDADAKCLYYLVERGAPLHLTDELMFAVTCWRPKGWEPESK
jgi:hypothetical protein